MKNEETEKRRAQRRQGAQTATSVKPPRHEGTKE
jgi:hypothetical protein